MADKKKKSKNKGKTPQLSEENAQFAKNINEVLMDLGSNHDLKKYGKKARRDAKNKRIRRFNINGRLVQEQLEKPQKGMEVIND